jgi:hypothetical protein
VLPRGSSPTDADPGRKDRRASGLYHRGGLGPDDRQIRQPVHIPADGPSLSHDALRRNFLRRRALESDDIDGRAGVSRHGLRRLPLADVERTGPLPAVHRSSASQALAACGHARLRPLRVRARGRRLCDPADGARTAGGNDRARPGLVECRD